MQKVLLANGDSWTFGSEIVAPEFQTAPGKGVGMGNSFTREGADYHSENDYYRIPRIWPSYLGELRGFDEVVNIAWPARSNDTIYRSTVHWLLHNYKPELMDLTVVIGWTSPERKNVVLTDGKMTEEVTIWPAMTESRFYESKIAKKYFDFHVRHLWTLKEAITRFVDQNFSLHLLCQQLEVKHHFFNSFYVPQNSNGLNEWVDIDYREAIESLHGNGLKGWKDGRYFDEHEILRLLAMWDAIPSNVFVNKELSMSFKSYVEKSVPEKLVWNGIHPSPEAHLVWAKYLSEKLN